MDSRNVSFGELWEFSRLVDYRVKDNKYWRKKLVRMIQRAYFMRDFKSLSDLVKHCYNLRSNTESVYYSRGMILLMSNISLMRYFDEQYISIFMEYNSKFSDRLKSRRRDIIGDMCHKADYGSLANSLRDELKLKLKHNRFRIDDVSELRAFEYVLKNEPSIEAAKKVAVLRTDPCFDIDLQSVFEGFEKKDWIVLINRVDRLKDSYESWKCLEHFLMSKADLGILDRIRDYVSDYWPRYHAVLEDEDIDLSVCKISVFRKLGIAQ